MLAHHSTGIKKKLDLVIAIVCLLTLFLSTASCMVAQPPRMHQTSCGECPQHAPLSQDTPICCTSHQQPSAATTSIEVEQPAPIARAFTSIPLDLHAQSAAFSAANLYETPPIPPLITLRI
jgi:hypothetical protein